jgi:hypothetical protein
MANRRMFAKTIIDSDMFLDMPSTTQNLYFHLNMRADDEGFVNAPKKVMRVIQANTNDLDILVAKKFVLTFHSGVLVIKHWKLHNTIRKDRFTKTLYTEEKNLLFEKENGSYTFTRYENAMKQLSSDPVEYLDQETTNWQPDGNHETTNGEHRLGKVSLVESSINLEETYKEKNTKKKIVTSYDPQANSLSKMITAGINHWNSKDNLPRCKYTILTLPKVGDIKTKFDVFRDGEILQAIDNLSKAYDGLDQTYRPKNFQNFIVTSLDNWFEERKVEIKRSYRTGEERRFWEEAMRIAPDDKEFIEKHKKICIDSLAAIGEEFIDYE